MPDEKIQLGDFVLDVARYELTRSGRPIRLERIPMDLLILLVRARGRLVTREDIIERLWGKDVFLDTDNSINTAMRKIRRALGETPDEPRFIETVPAKGYRFKIANDGAQNAAKIAESVRPKTMVAVLPFDNLSGDPTQEYFSDGLTEETIMRLGKMSPRELGIIARTSSMVYKHTEKSVVQIGRELGVDYIIEGSVRREPHRIRVTAQLIRVSDQIHLWAENFDRPPHSVLDIHSEVGAAIAEQVKLELTPEGRQQPAGDGTSDPQAYDDYLHGRYHWARVTFPEMQKASAYFRKATERDPRFALAYAGLADSLMTLPINSDVPAKEVLADARVTVAKALGLGAETAEAHNSAATLKFWFEWDFHGAERAAREAIRLDANYSLAYLYLAHILSNVGRHEEALEVIRMARVLDPFSLITNAMYGQFLYQAGRVEESVEQLRATLEMESRFWVGQICLAKSYGKQRRHAEALECCEKAWQFSGGNSEALSLAGYVHAISGDHAKAETNIAEMLERRSQRYVPPYNVALVYAGLGRHQDAIAWLEKAYDERDVHMVFLCDHKWDGLRTTSGFQNLFKQAGFQETR
jgi:TolB-like protein/Flp pilus assembly protein TadD